MRCTFITKTLLFVCCLFLSQIIWADPKNNTQNLNRNTSTSFLRNYFGLRGLFSYADTHFSGDVSAAYIYIANRTDKEIFEKSGWKKYEIELDQIREKVSFFYNEAGKLNKEALSLMMQLEYASLYHNGNILKAFHSGWLILSDKIPLLSIQKKLKWEEYPGYVNEFLREQKTLYNDNGYLNPEYKELSGQIRFANEQGLDIQTALERAKMISPYNSFIPTGWIRGYTGSIENLNKLLKKMADELDYLKNTGQTVKQSKYKGIEGQMILGKEMNIHNMLVLYNYVRSIGSTMSFTEIPYALYSFLNALLEEWIPFDGNLRRFKKEKLYFLDKKNKLRPDIVTTTGLATLARKHYQGKMALAFDRGQIIFKVYGISMFHLLWLKVEKDSDTFFKEQQRLYNKNGTLKNKYRYHKGQVEYAEDWHGGDVYKSYEEGLILLRIPKISIPMPDQPIFYQIRKGSPISSTNINTIIDVYITRAMDKHLGWTEFPITRTSRVFQNIRKILVNKIGKPRKEWEDTTGQIKYVKKYTGGSMTAAWETQSYVFGNEPNLGWQPIFLVDMKTIEEITQRFLNPNGQLKTKYKLQNGYLFYATEYTEGDLDKAFTHSTWLPSSIRDNLKWYIYRGSIKDFERDTALIEHYQDMKGLLKFALKFYKGSIIRAYHNMLAIFEGNEEKLYRKTGWLPYYNDIITFYVTNMVHFYERDKKVLILENGEINSVYKGTEGYIRFSEKYYNGDMHTAYYNTRSVLEAWDLSLIMEWYLFPGTTVEFRHIKEFILNNPTNINQSFSQLTSRNIKMLVEYFIRTNNIVSYYKKNIERQIRAFLDLNNAELCRSAF